MCPMSKKSCTGYLSLTGNDVQTPALERKGLAGGSRSRERPFGFVFLLTSLFIGLCPVAAQVEELKGKYTFAATRIADEELASIGSLGRQYLKAVEGLRDRMRAGGNLDTVLVLDREIRRFTVVKDVTPAVEPTKIEDLDAMMQSYRVSRKKIRVGNANKFLGMTENYLKVLRTQEIERVKAEKTDDAKLLRAEQVRIKQDSRVLAALDLVKEARAVAEAQRPSRPVPQQVVRPVKVPKYMQKGLVLYLPFDELGAVPPQDLSGKPVEVDTRHATKVNEGKYNTAYAFDGKKDYLKVAHDDRFSLPGEMTISIWVKLEDWVNGGGIISKGSVTGAGGAFLADITSGKFRFVRWRAAGVFETISSYQLPQKNVWQHLALVSTKERLQIYVNGSVASTKPGGELWATNTKPILIGMRHYSDQDEDYAWGIKGLVDEIMMYDRALNGNEVKHLYEMGL